MTAGYSICVKHVCILQPIYESVTFHPSSLPFLFVLGSRCQRSQFTALREWICDFKTMFCIFCSAWPVVFPPRSPEIPVGVLRTIQDGCANDPPNLCIIKIIVKLL